MSTPKFPAFTVKWDEVSPFYPPPATQATPTVAPVPKPVLTPPLPSALPGAKKIPSWVTWAPLPEEKAAVETGFMKGIAEKLAAENPVSPSPGYGIPIKDIRLKDIRDSMLAADTGEKAANILETAQRAAQEQLMKELDSALLDLIAKETTRLADDLAKYTLDQNFNGVQNMMYETMAEAWNGNYLQSATTPNWNLGWVRDDGAYLNAHIQLPNDQELLLDSYPRNTDIDIIKTDIENYLIDEYGVHMGNSRLVKREVEQTLRDWSTLSGWNDSIRGITTRGDNLYLTIGDQKFKLSIPEIEDAIDDERLDSYLREQVLNTVQPQVTSTKKGKKTMSETKSTREMATNHLLDASKMVGAAQVQNLLVAALREITSPLLTEDQKKLLFETEAGRTVIDLILPLVAHQLGQYETAKGRLVPHGEYLERAGDLAFKAQSARYGFIYGDKIASALPGIKDQLVTLVAGLKQAAESHPAIAEDLGLDLDDMGLRDEAEEVVVATKKVAAVNIAKTM